MSHAAAGAGWTRREFLTGMGAAAGAAALGALAARAMEADAETVKPIRKPLRMLPVLIYETPRRRPHTSWRSWGGIQTEAQAQAERRRIEAECAKLMKRADFPLEILPVEMCKSMADARRIVQGDQDGIILYAAGGWVNIQEALTDPKKWNLMFVRHRSGPVYLWYEIAHNRYLRKTVDEFGQPGMTVDDVVVDDYDDVLWRLRALAGLKNTLGKRVVAVGGPAGWGAGGRAAPEHARKTWRMDLETVSYPELGKMLNQTLKDERLVRRARRAAGEYLAGQGVKLETDREFVDRAFVLTEVFKKLMAASNTDAITINLCMGTIMNVSKTTACLPLSLINDAGLMAFCESDFVVIPAGILLHSISGKPVFLNDPTYPHHGVVTQAHCTAPRRMDGRSPEPARILTHFESDYGAAPKVEMRKGQIVTELIPDFSNKRWVGFEGEIVDAPFLDICRSQIDVRMHADTNRVLREMKGFHWMTCYGNYLREVGYALRRVGVEFEDLTEKA